MIYYSAFLMDTATRRILLFCRDRHRLWQSAHTSYRVTPKTPQENEAGIDEAFVSAFALNPAAQPSARTIYGNLFSLTIASTHGLATSFEYGDILPWDIEETYNLNLDHRTRQSLKANIGLLMFFADVDRDVWCNMQDFAHAPSRT